MIATTARIALAASLLAPASAGTSTPRPRVALTASPAQVELQGSGRARVHVTNSGSSRVVVDVGRAGFALDLRGRPKIVHRTLARSAIRWLATRPRTLVLRPHGIAALAIAAKLPRRAEPGDHDALVLLTTRPRRDAGIAVRMRLGIVVVVRAPGTIVRRLELRRVRVVSKSRARLLELLVRNRGNVTESLGKGQALVTLSRGGRVLARLATGARELRPRTNGILQFRYRGPVRGRVLALVELSPEDGGRLVRRTFHVRL